MAPSRWHVPIRIKIIALIGVALGGSLASYTWISTQLISDDKVSYIYDFTLARVKAGAETVESQIKRTISASTMIAGLVHPKGEATHRDSMLRAYDSAKSDLGLSGLLILKPVSEDRFSEELAFGDAATLRLILAQLGWTPAIFKRSGVLVGAAIDGKIPIGTKALDSLGKEVAVLSLLPVSSELLPTGAKGITLAIIDRTGRVLVSATAEGSPSLTPDPKLSEGLLEGEFTSGVRHWTQDGAAYIVGYQKFGLEQLWMVGMIPRDVAYSAAKSLVERVIVLALSVLFISFGLTLVFAKKLTQRLNQIWQATLRVAQGDFTFKISDRSRGRDEVTGLVDSFNMMSGKIVDLMKATEQKARMEKELETAQAVQSRFFPASDYRSGQIRIAGASAPASECAGDWWGYAELDRHMIIAIGDVTGHGVSSALVTAAAHGAFSVIMRQLKLSKFAEPPLDVILRNLNEAVASAGRGEVSMTFYISSIDCKTGKMRSINASHCAPYLLDSTGKTSPLVVQHPSRFLGDAGDYVAGPATEYQLSPGDTLMFYTDGLFETRPADGEKFSKKGLVRDFAAAASKDPEEASGLCRGVLQQATEFYGKDGGERPDDITVVIAKIPSTASFVKPLPKNNVA